MKSERRKFGKGKALAFAVLFAVVAFLIVSIGCVSAESSFTQQNANGWFTTGQDADILLSGILADKNNKSAFSASWTIEAVDAPKYFTAFYPRAIAIDGFNRYISYYDYTNDDLKYATDASGSWVTSTIDSEGDMGWYSSIAIDKSNNKVHISYYDYTNGDLKYATDASGSWVTSTIDSVGCLEHHYISSPISIALDSNNKVHISYCDYYNDDLKYATDASGAWVTSTIDSGVEWDSSIAIDSNNKVHISYHNYVYLKYATDASGAWVTSTIVKGGERYTSIAIDSNNKVHISCSSSITFFDPVPRSTYYLKYATNASGAWVTSTIDSGTSSSFGCSMTSIAIDSNNKVHISYQDQFSDVDKRDLKYATNASGAWVTSTIDSVGDVCDVGEYSSIAIDSKDKVHISYYDASNDSLKYATDVSGSWVTSTIDSSGNVGEDTSIAVDSNNKVHISYYDYTNNDLKYATNRVSYPAPDISVSPVSYDFGSVNVGSTSAPRTFIISNTGDADLVIGTLSVTGTDASEFTIQNDNCSGQTIAPSDTCTVDVVFAPASEGAKSADLCIPSNDPDENPVNIALSGTVASIFDTGPGTYPSIMGTHKGEIKPSQNINVSKLYTYACVGTGGHTESIELYENDELIANGTWSGYQEDWHNITLHNVTGASYVMLLEDQEYNYTIRTGSYPQIIHNQTFTNEYGTITCTKFIDANGRVYYDWIPAIRLE